MRIEDVICFARQGAFPNDDQAAIRRGAVRDGHLYAGDPVTAGYARIRQASAALCVLLVLEDGTVVAGDGVSVQYAGAGGREPVLDAAAAAERFGMLLRETFVHTSVASFRESNERLTELALPIAIEYGVSQALLGATAAASPRDDRRDRREGVRDRGTACARCRCSPNVARTVTTAWTA